MQSISSTKNKHGAPAACLVLLIDHEQLGDADLDASVAHAVPSHLVREGEVRRERGGQLGPLAHRQQRRFWRKVHGVQRAGRARVVGQSVLHRPGHGVERGFEESIDPIDDRDRVGQPPRGRDDALERKGVQHRLERLVRLQGEAERRPAQREREVRREVAGRVVDVGEPELLPQIGTVSGWESAFELQEFCQTRPRDPMR